MNRFIIIYILCFGMLRIDVAYSEPAILEHVDNIFYQPASLSTGTQSIVSDVMDHIKQQKEADNVVKEDEHISIERFSFSPSIKGIMVEDQQDIEGGQEDVVASNPLINMEIHTEGQAAKNIHELLGEAFDALLSGQAEVSIVLYRKALAMDEENTTALFGLATAYQRNGQDEQAKHIYEDLLHIDPAHREGVNNFLVLMAKESPEGALQELHRLRAIDPDYSPFYAHSALIHAQLHRLDQAIDDMKHAVRLSPHNMSYRYNLAVLLDRAERWDLAVDLYKQLIKASYTGAFVPGSVEQMVERLSYIRSHKVIGG